MKNYYWRLRRLERRLRKNPQTEYPNLLLQYFWYLSSVEKSKIGYGPGLLTWLRNRAHQKQRRKLHITVLENESRGLGLGRLMAFWINERSAVCTASVNTRIEEADIVFVQSQDPITEAEQAHFLRLLERAKPGVCVLNHPAVYNAYHDEHIFERLAAAGVNVPRDHFDSSDYGITQVVYKRCGMHAAEKIRELYAGERPGFRAFEFIDSRDADGRYRRYRAHYLAGAVRSSNLMRCTHWNVCLKSDPELVPTFELTAEEIAQIRLLAQISGLDYFAVDLLRRSGDEKPYFVDINIYPMTEAILIHSSQRYRGIWHAFDTPMRLGIAEPGGGPPFCELFDQAMLAATRPASGLPALDPATTEPAHLRGEVA